MTKALTTPPSGAGGERRSLMGTKRRLTEETALQANTGEVKSLRAETLVLEELVADLSPKNRLLKKHERARTDQPRGDDE